MKIKMWLAIFGSAMAAVAQTKVDLRAQTRTVDFSAASTTKPFKSGTTLPGACSIGEAFFKTDAFPGANWYACTVQNVWTIQTGSTGNNNGPVTRSLDLSDLQVTKMSGTVLSMASGTWGSGSSTFSYGGGLITIGSLAISNATNTQPIVVTVSSTASLRNGDTVNIAGVLGNLGANGTFVALITSGTQLQLVGSIGTGAYAGGGTLAGTGNGTAYIYATDSGNILVEHASSAGLLVTCSGACTINQVPSPSFAASAIPMAIATISGGTWLSVADGRRFLSNRAFVAGLGISVADAGGTARIAVDATVARIPAANIWTGSNSFTAATRTAPFRTGVGTPVAQACTAADTYWQSDATSGENLWECLNSGSPGTWQLAPTGSGSHAPVIEDEFLSTPAGASGYGQYQWRSVGDNAPVPDQLSGAAGYNHPGVYSLSTNGAANSSSSITLAAANGAQQFVNLGGTTGWTLEAIAVTDAPIPGNQFGLRFGLSDDPASQSAANAIQVRYNKNTGCTVTGTDSGFAYENRSVSVATTGQSAVSIAGSQSIHLRIRSVTAGTALFSLSIDGGAFTSEVAVAGAPVAPVSPFFSITSCDGTAKKIFVDYFRFVPGALAR